MKKLVMAALAAVCSMVMAADELVYEYKASIKRLDYSVSYASKAKMFAQKFNVKSDTIKGFVILPKCNACNGDADMTSIYDQWNGVAYLTVVGNKYAPASRKVFKTKVMARAGMFGAVQYTATGEGPVGVPGKAQMALDFYVPGEVEIEPDFDPADILKKIASDPNTRLYNGFYGLTNWGSNPNLVMNTGFGTIKQFKDSTPGSFSVCGGYIAGENFVCNIVNTITGTLVGYPTYIGPCGHIPMWDLCVETRDGNPYYMAMNEAVICGTWNLKFNKALTEAEDQVGAILKKLNAKAENVFEVEAE